MRLSLATWRTNPTSARGPFSGTKPHKPSSRRNSERDGRERSPMKLQKVAVLAAIAAISFGFFCTHSYGGNAEPASRPNAADSNEKFLGRWDLTLKAPDREYPSWLELREEGGQLQAQMVGRWGNARPLPKASISNGKLTFVSPKDEEA